MEPSFLRISYCFLLDFKLSTFQANEIDHVKKKWQPMSAIRQHGSSYISNRVTSLTEELQMRLFHLISHTGSLPSGDQPKINGSNENMQKLNGCYHYSKSGL